MKHLILALLAAFPAFVQAQTGPVGHWRFDEGSGTIAADASGNANTGTLTNGPLWVAGKEGPFSLDFDGVNDHVLVPDSASINSPTTAITVAAWVWRDSGFSRQVMGRQSGTGTLDQWTLFVDGAGKPMFLVDTTAAGSPSVAGPSVLPIGVWTHLAGVYDGTLAKLYVDGALAASAAHTGNLVVETTKPVVIGASRNDATTNGNQFLDGKIDEAKLWNRALTATEVQVLASPPATLSTPANFRIVTGPTIANTSSIQLAINANPNGTVFNLGAGEFVNQQFIPKPGNQFIGAPGGTTILTGSNSVNGVYSSDGTVNIPGVVLKDFTIEKYDLPHGPSLAQDECGGGAIHGANGWTFINMTFRLNNCVGLNMGPDSVVTGGKYIDNGHAGIQGGPAHRSIVQGAEIARNNTNGGNPEFDAAGVKFAVSDGFVFRNNYVHDNVGPGLWCDINCSNGIIEGNTVINNHSQGIVYEISGGGANGTKIRNNVSNDNGATLTGRPQIFVSSSSGVEVSGNNVRASGVGAGITMQADPGRTPGTSNNSFHNNIVTFTGSTNWYGFPNFGGIVGSGNSSNNNAFHVLNTADLHWFWNTAFARSFDAHKTASGQDLNSTIQVGNASVPGNTQGCPALTGC